MLTPDLLNIDYANTLLRTFVTDSFVDDHDIKNQLIDYDCFFEWYANFHSKSKLVSPEIIDYAIQTHLLWKIYLHIHVAKRMISLCPNFTYLSEFKQMKQLFQEIANIREDDNERYPLRKLSINLHINELRDKITKMVSQA